MTIDITIRAMTSDITPENAFRVHGHGETVWRLSWLPEHRLTRDQARAGMELDEILSDPEVVFDDDAHGRAAERAARLGVGVEHAVVLLAQRLASRMDRGSGRGSVAVEAPEPITARWSSASAAPVSMTSGARSRHLWS
ncbi:hypothetical protein [Nocardia jejuensis]|uniref:hypothetical protein n=1 Tax=Nocardia jejuensis TaxID=328049 RepID=UPI0008331495|nr:hypothetical protein [Nocardia jejuensis]